MRKKSKKIPGVQLYDYQLDAVRRLKNGSILCGGVGSGKSRTALAYYYILEGGKLNTETYYPMNTLPRNLYIITTARKRDTNEWEDELSPFLLSSIPENNRYDNKVVIDSWNNIKKYTDVEGAFFIFDEQRVVGKGVWVKSFLKIAKHNRWILLSATPGDKWEDYIPVFVANGFYKNRTEFTREHIVYKPFRNYLEVDRYLNTGRLIRLRRDILVNMDFKRKTIAHHEYKYVMHDIEKYKNVTRTRWDIFRDQPIANASAYCQTLRRVVNSDPSRILMIQNLCRAHPKAIIFYNYDYELEILKNVEYGPQTLVAEWNGHRHDPIPDGTRWVYLVQYTAGAEGWNCIQTDTIIFYSLNYSYKTMQQASGRIDRLNTPFRDLYYYYLMSRAGIDLAIRRALKEKKKFNEGMFYTNS